MSTTSCCPAWRSATCCARRTRMRASARSTPAKAKAAPGVLAVLTGADWEASGFGDLPVPGGLKRRDGSPLYRPRYPALVEDRVRWVGDYVAFVVAETRHAGDGRGRADRGRLRAAAGDRLDRATRASRARRSCGTIAPTTSASSSSRATRRRPTRPSRAPPTSSSIASSSTASPPPPWSRAARSAIYDPTDDRYTIYTTLQRTHAYPRGARAARAARCRRTRCASSPATSAAASA